MVAALGAALHLADAVRGGRAADLPTPPTYGWVQALSAPKEAL